MIIDPDDVPDFVLSDASPSDRRREAAARQAVDQDRQSAVQCLETWGHFVKDKDALAALATKEELRPADRCQIGILVAATEKKATKKAREAEALSVSGVDWPEADVERYVRVLTGRDADFATERNRRGWNASHSSTGHWCCAMLEWDRELAIRVARTIVGGYMRQVDGDSA